LVNEVIATSPVQEFTKITCGTRVMETLSGYENRMHCLDTCRRSTSYLLQSKPSATHMQDFADMAGIEFLLIGKKTDLYNFKNELRWNEMYYQLHENR
jgi:L-arabinose isomerase